MTKWTSDNPWREIEFELKERQYRQANNKLVTYYTVEWVNEFKSPDCLKYQIRNKQTGKTAMCNKPYFRCNKEDGSEPDLLWPKKKWNDPDTIFPIEDIEIRIEDTNYQRFVKVLNTLQVGDFVKCKGTRSGDWNKVEQINGEILYGPKYTKPEVGYMRYASSDNHLSKVIKIVRDGKELEL